MRKIIVAAFAALTMFISAPASYAGNGTSNFYLSSSCSPPGAVGARLSVTNWDIYTSSQMYHVDLNPDRSRTPSGGIYVGLTSYSITIDGVKMSGVNDQYKSFGGRGRHTIVGRWKTPFGGFKSCSIVI